MPSQKTARKKKALAEKPVSSTKDFERLLLQTDAKTHYVLKLYITGSTERSLAAIANVRALCDEHLRDRYDLEVVDIYQQPSLAASREIIAAPTLVKEFPAPLRRMVGDLGNRARVLVGLDLRSPSGDGGRPKTKGAKI